MAEVTWRTHPVHTAYEASSDGRIRSVDRWVLCNHRSGTLVNRFYPSVVRKPSKAPNGYLGVKMSENGILFDVRVHRFVCEAFHGLPTDSALVVRHINGNRIDNRAENLEWGTSSDNQYDRIRHGRNHRVLQTHCSKGHEFTPENTFFRPDRPKSHRNCRACQVVYNESRRVKRLTESQK